MIVEVLKHKKINFRPSLSYKYPYDLRLFHNCYITFSLSSSQHIIYSSNSNKIEDQLTIAFQVVMKEAMSMLQAEEVAAAVASSSTREPNRR
jgi:hypothetical protein